MLSNIIDIITFIRLELAFIILYFYNLFNSFFLLIFYFDSEKWCMLDKKLSRERGNFDISLKEVWFIIIIILFRSEKSDACPWKPRLAVRHNRVQLIVHSSLLSPLSYHRSDAYYLHTHTYTQASTNYFIREPPPARLRVGGSIFSIFVAYVMFPWMSINAFYSRDPFIKEAFLREFYLKKKPLLKCYNITLYVLWVNSLQMKNKIRLRRNVLNWKSRNFPIMMKRDAEISKILTVNKMQR